MSIKVKIDLTGSLTERPRSLLSELLYTINDLLAIAYPSLEENLAYIYKSIAIIQKKVFSFLLVLEKKFSKKNFILTFDKPEDSHYYLMSN